LSVHTQDAGRRKRLRKLAPAALLLVLLAVVIEALLVARHGYALWKHGIRLKALAQNPTSVLRPEGPAQIGTNLAGIERGLRGLRVALGPALRPIWLPWRAARENLLAMDELLRVGAELAQAGQVANDGLQAIVEAVEARQTPEEGQEVPGMSEVLFEGLVGARPHFDETARQVGLLAEDVASLSEAHLWSPLSQVVPTVEYYLRLGSAALETAAAAPTLLGQTGPAHYLVLAQNNDELRATGGFITGIGLVTLERGKVGELTINDSYDFDKFTVEHPWPPEPMQRYMGIDQWATRDGNWSPDFRTAAKDVEDLYHIENATQIRGVVAFDMLGLQALVKAAGTLYLEEYDEHIDGTNVVQKTREYWAPKLPEGTTLQEWFDQQGWKEVADEWWIHRKDFMGRLAEALVAKLQREFQLDQLGGLIWAVKRAIDEKHILLYFHEPVVQGLLATAGMDGALGSGTSGDYLLAVDTNMGYNKVNLNVDRLMDYELALNQAATAQATLTITYQNRSPAQPVCIHGPRIAETYDLMAQDCYWNYLRVYVPRGSQLVAAEGVTETETLADDEGKTVFAAFFVVPAGESQTVRFTYRIPDLGGEEYRLLVQKQAGTDAVPVRVRIALPPDATVLSAEPKPQSVQQGVVSYELGLRRDRTLVLKLR
jgi:hypothetical protein